MASSTSPSGPDPLFDMRNSFYLGNFQQTINEAHKLKATDIEKDILMYRAYIGQRKYAVVKDEIHSGQPKEVQYLKTLADYLSADSNKRSKIVDDLEQKIATVDSKDHIQLIVAATIYYHEENYETALRLLHSSDYLECSAMMLQIYLKIDRVDLARKELKKMQEMDDDSTLTQLATAWLNIAMGGEKLQEAFYIFQELSDKYGSTPLLLNGLAVTQMGQGKFEDAESQIQEALEKDSNNPETLINMIVVAQNVGKSAEVSNRYMSQLKDSNYNHQFVKDYLAKEAELERLIKEYAINAI